MRVGNKSILRDGFDSLSDWWAGITKFSVRLTVRREHNRLRNLYSYIREPRTRSTFRVSGVPKGADGCIVLTHSGTRPIPEYASDCIEQIRLFSDIPIYFVCGRDKNIPDRISRNVHVVYIEDVPVSGKHLEFYRKLSSFRSKYDNFFQHTSERFFILEEVIRSLNLKNVIHMENDILLYEDAGILVEKIGKYFNDITVPRMSERYCMAAVMYIPDAGSLERFLDYVLEHVLDKGTNDMIMLAGYLREKDLKPLPIINKGYVEKYGLVNKEGDRAPCEHLDEFTLFTEELGGFFDPAPIGQYLGGTDQKPKGVTDNAGYENVKSYVDISLLNIRWENEKEGLIPFMYWNGKKYKIYDLHIHCKELNRFRSDTYTVNGTCRSDKKG